MTKPNHKTGRFTVVPSQDRYGAYEVKEAAEEQMYQISPEVFSKNDSENARLFSVAPILLKIRAEAEKLLLSYQNKVIIPPDRIGSQWEKLKQLLEASK